MAGVIVVIGGQQVPDLSKQLWANLADKDELDPIENPAVWLEYCHRKGYANIQLRDIQVLTTIFGGNPGNLTPWLVKLTTGLQPVIGA